MLAQRKSFSAKRGGLAAVTSGLIFLQKKKRNVRDEIKTEKLSTGFTQKEILDDLGKKRVIGIVETEDNYSHLRIEWEVSK